tara:strand:- start:246 stop:650 length:405 start_codon:yes stop_codon:yes gene_type:complete
MRQRRPRRVRPPVEIKLPSSAILSDGILTVSDRQLTDLFNTVKPLQVRKELRKHKSRSARLDDALQLCQDAKLEVDSLFEEIETWAQGMEGTNLEYSFKYQQLEECKQYLEEIQEILSNLESFEGGVVEFPSMF